MLKVKRGRPGEFPVGETENALHLYLQRNPAKLQAASNQKYIDFV